MAETGVAMELANEEFQIETHGIDIIPESQRGGTPRRLFWIWLGGTFYVNGLVVGGLLPFLGLNLWQSLTAILLAAICTVGLGIFTVYGARYGTSTMVVGRATMGRRGQLLPTLLTWLGAVGWETVVSVSGWPCWFSTRKPSLISSEMAGRWSVCRIGSGRARALHT